MSSLYIALGSTAIRSMMAFIKRQLEEGVYDTRGDIFVGIDSNRTCLQELEALEPDRARVCGIQLEISQGDPWPVVARAFQPSWTNLTIPDDGVGGDRRRSAVAMSWRKDSRLLTAFRRVGGGDAVVLMATSFGGTASGLFYNVAYWVRNHIATMPEEERQPRPKFYAIVMLPGHPTFRPYPLAPNMCAFFKEMQLVSWASQLSTSENSRAFRLPAVALAHDTDCVPIWDPFKDGESDFTHILVDRVFMVPTPPEGERVAIEAMAEVAFLLGPLGVWSHLPQDLIDLATQRSDGKSRVAAGFYFVGARSGKMGLLKRRFYEIANVEWTAFTTNHEDRGSEGYRLCTEVLERMVEAMESDPEARDNLQRRKERISEALRGDLESIGRNLPAALDDFCAAVVNHPYKWPSFAEFLAHVQRELERRASPVSGIYLSTLAAVYNEQLERMRRLARQIASFDANDALARLREDTTREVKGIIGRAIRLQKYRGNHWAARLVDGSAAVEMEIQKAAIEAIGTVIARFVEASRVAACAQCLTPPIDVAAEMSGPRGERYREVEDRLRKLAMDETSARAPFIFEDRAQLGKLDVSSLTLGTHTGFGFANVFLRALLADHCELDSILERAERDGVERLARQAEKMGAANPLRQIKTRLDCAGSVRPFSKCFFVQDAAPCHYTFYLEFGEVQPLRWQDIVDRLGFRSFETLGQYVADAPFRPADVRAPRSNSFFGRSVPESPDIHGLWLGNLVADALPRDVLQCVYRHMPMHQWEAETADDEQRYGGRRLRLMSAWDMVCLGCTLGAIERTAQKVFGDRPLEALRVNISVRTTQGDLELMTSAAARHCFARFDGVVRLSSVPLAWIEKVIHWVRSQDYARDMEVAGIERLQGMLKMEDAILTAMDLTVPDRVKMEVDELRGRIESRVRVELV